jgi:hypothetical protein
VPRSRNKYSRARIRERSRRTRHQRSSGWFYATIAVIIVVGSVTIGAIVVSRDESAAAPTIEDHWHAAFGVNICGEWLSNPATFSYADDNPGVQVGIHTHGDGFIHIHPHASSETGGNATLGKFLSYGGWSVSEDSISVWRGPNGDPQKSTWSNGDRCPSGSGEPGKGKPGEIVFEINCKSVSGNPSDHKLADQEVVAIGFVPKGVEIGAPPNAASAPENDSGTSTEPEAINQKGCRPSAENNPGVADTTPPATTTPPTTSSPTP